MLDRLKTWMMGLGLRQARRVVVFVVGMTLRMATEAAKASANAAEPIRATSLVNASTTAESK